VVRSGRRERGRGAARILYWFRTPPGVRVGRAPLDEETIREIEALHPGIRFDWQQILKGEEESVPEVRPEAPAHLPMGPEGLERLRNRYGQVIAGIRRRVTDPDTRVRLLQEAERLNPDRWESADEIKVALEQYESVHESLRSAVLGSTRRRKRRPRPGEGAAGAPREGGAGALREDEAGAPRGAGAGATREDEPPGEPSHE
jgi:hypothetical protein